MELENEESNGKEDNSSSFISRVSESTQVGENHFLLTDNCHSKHPSLSWEFPNSVDRKDRDIYQLGNCDVLGSSQKSICDLMQKIKIKGVGRLRRKSNAKNPFNIGNCKFLSKNRKLKNPASKVRNSLKIDTVAQGTEEAVQILETTELIGLKLNKDHDSVLNVIKEQLLKGNI